MEEMLKAALNSIQKNVAEIMVTFHGGKNFSVTVDQAVKNFKYKKLSNLGDLWMTLKDVYTFIEIHYKGSTKHEDIEYVALDGLLETLDPHSNILTPKIYNEFKIGTKGKFGGIGIVIGTKDGQLTVISPLEGTPAWRAGVKAKDKIVQIDEESTINITLTEAVEKLRGTPGTNVTVTIERSSRPTPFTVNLKRTIIKIDSVKSASFDLGGKNFGYIKIKSFQQDTDKEFSKQLKLLTANPKFSGLILDLRNNPGGLLGQSVTILDKFLSKGTIVSTVGAGKIFIDASKANIQGTEPDYPVVALINEGSASASEIVAGTLQDYGRAILVGNQSFGKGSVQTIYDIGDGSALKLTIAEYLTAGKNSIQSVGVVPDIKMVPVIVKKDAMNLIEDKTESEESLEHHLSKSSKQTRESKYSIRYLETEVIDDEEEIRKREYSDDLNLEKDFAVQFAARLIADNITSVQQLETVTARATLSKSRGEQQEIIAEAIRNVGINWSACTEGGKPLLQITYSILQDKKKVAMITAGEKAELLVGAKNIGTGSFCKLIGSMDSKESFLNNRELVFGNIGPQESKEWTIPLDIPKSTLSKTVPVKIKFEEANKNVPSGLDVLVPIKERPSPAFAFNYKLGKPENVKVETAGIPVGKRIPVVVRVKNIGSGATDNAVVMIKNVDSKGVFIDIGRAVIGKLEPGQTKEVTLKFHTEVSFKDTEFKLELSVIDQELLAIISSEISFKSSSSTIDPPAGRWYQGPDVSLASLQLPVETETANFHFNGSITDDQQVKDYFIFVEGKKVAYSSNAKKLPSFTISADLPLELGNNQVSIVARDNYDLMTRRSFVVNRRK